MALVVFVLLVAEPGLVEVALPVASVGVGLVWFATALLVEESEACVVFVAVVVDESTVAAVELFAPSVLVGVASLGVV